MIFQDKDEAQVYFERKLTETSLKAQYLHKNFTKNLSKRNPTSSNFYSHLSEEVGSIDSEISKYNGYLIDAQMRDLNVDGFPLLEMLREQN